MWVSSVLKIYSECLLLCSNMLVQCEEIAGRIFKFELVIWVSNHIFQDCKNVVWVSNVFAVTCLMSFLRRWDVTNVNKFLKNIQIITV